MTVAMGVMVGFHVLLRSTKRVLSRPGTGDCDCDDNDDDIGSTAVPMLDACYGSRLPTGLAAEGAIPNYGFAAAPGMLLEIHEQRQLQQVSMWLLHRMLMQVCLMLLACQHQQQLGMWALRGITRQEEGHAQVQPCGEMSGSAEEEEIFFDAEYYDLCYDTEEDNDIQEGWKHI
jgi:hypothetical protein